jgi:tetratricopeptide (TPR) repeat protein
MERVEAEIRRLRSIDPSWQPPPDLLGGGEAVDENALWALFAKGDYAAVRARIAELQTQVPSYTPSADLMRQLDLAEASARLVAASDASQWSTVVSIGRSQPELLTCGRTDNVWRTAEALARLGDSAAALSMYKSVIDLCVDQSERVATLQKADAFLTEEQMQSLFASAKARVAGDAAATAEIAEIETQLLAGRGTAPATAAAVATPTTASAGPAPRPIVGGDTRPGSSGGGGGGGGRVIAAYESHDYATCLRLTEGRISTDDALMRAWCLYELARPTEAAAMFARVREESGSPEQVQTATFGTALTLLRRGQITDAIQTARSGGLTEKQQNDVYAEALAQGAVQAYEREDWREVVRLLDTRATLAVERRDLGILHGFALYHLERYSQALELFRALDATLSTPESREGIRVVQNAIIGG